MMNMNKKEEISNKNQNLSINISKPIIKDMPDKVRLSCDINYNGDVKNLYYEVDKEYGEYLCNERLDAFVIAILPYAMFAGLDIYCESPVTETLLHNINEVLIPTLTSVSNKRSSPLLMKVHAPTENAPISGNKVATGISLGVDSSYTILKNIDSEYETLKLTHLINLQGPFSIKRLSGHVKQIKKVAKELNIPVTFITTNIYVLKKFFNKPKFTHGKTFVYTNLSAAYAMNKLVKTYYFSTAYDLSKFTIDINENSFAEDILLFLAYCFSTPDINILIEGLDVTRYEKILSISDQKIVQENLRVCVKETYNCTNNCFKCKRSLMEIDMLGLLDNYRKVFDVDYYLKHKPEYLKDLIKGKDGRDKTMIRPLYQHFLEKEPENMAKAKKLLEERAINSSKSLKITKTLRKIRKKLEKIF